MWLWLTVGLVVDFDDDAVQVAVDLRGIEDVVVVGVDWCETTLRHSNVESMDLDVDFENEVGDEDGKVFVFVVFVVVVSPPSVPGVSSCVMFVVVIAVVCSVVGLYAVSWLVCRVVSSSRQKFAGSITLIRLHAWCHLCGSL